jgi:hypothetical protein
MAELPTGNRVLRLIDDYRKAALHTASAPISFERSADQVGLYYTAAMSRYNVLDELYLEVAELLKQGDDLD